MTKWITILFTHLWALSPIAQNSNCGFKTACLCEDTNESVPYHFEYSDVVIHGQVIDIDTIGIAEIITKESIFKIEEDKLDRSQCAKKVLETNTLIKVKIEIEEIYKGLPRRASIFVMTPLEEAFCGYSEFIKGEHYLIYGTRNKMADVYFLWTFDIDYFQLKPAFSIWTNKCKATKRVEDNEWRELKAIKESLKHN